MPACSVLNYGKWLCGKCRHAFQTATCSLDPPTGLSETSELEVNLFGNSQKSCNGRCLVRLLYFLGRSWELEFASHCALGQKEDVWQVPVTLIQTAALFFVDPVGPMNAGLYQFSETSELEPRPLGSSQKNWSIIRVDQNLCSLGRREMLGVVSQLYGTLPVVEIMMRVCLNFPTNFDMACFIHAHGKGASHLVSEFLTK